MDNFKTCNVLCVDDDSLILNSLNRVLRSLGVNVLLAKNGAEALKLLKEFNIHLVIADMQMPVMNGADLLARISTEWPDTQRFLLTGYSDMESTVKAINEGGIHRYIAKPWDNDTLLSNIKDALQKVMMSEENKRLQAEIAAKNEKLIQCNKSLEERVEKRTKQIKIAMARLEVNKKGLEKVLYNFISANPNFDGHLSVSIARLCEKLASKMQLSKEEVKTISLAGLLCEIGLVGVDDKLYKAKFAELNYEQQKAFYAQIEHVPLILSPVHEHMQEIIEIICQQFEQYNGEGYPGKIAGSEMKEGVKILSAARDFFWYTTGRFDKVHHKIDRALFIMKNASGIKYAPEVIELLYQDKTLLESLQPESGLNTKQLKPGMELRESIFSNNHILLLSEGHELTKDSIKKLREFEHNQDMALTVWVKQ